jgi:predicted DNA-binding transcriptional regulator AlpA
MAGFVVSKPADIGSSGDVGLYHVHDEPEITRMTSSQNPAPLMLTVREVMDLTRMCKSSVHNMMDREILPKRKVGGKVLILRSAVYELLGLDAS